jgi:hypothetical protein
VPIPEKNGFEKDTAVCVKLPAPGVMYLTLYGPELCLMDGAHSRLRSRSMVRMESGSTVELGVG